MSHSGPSAAEIVLSEDERAELVRRAGLPGRRRADRARIILACAEGMANAEAARELGVAGNTEFIGRARLTGTPRAAVGQGVDPRQPKGSAVATRSARASAWQWSP